MLQISLRVGAKIGKGQGNSVGKGTFPSLVGLYVFSHSHEVYELIKEVVLFPLG